MFGVSNLETFLAAQSIDLVQKVVALDTETTLVGVVLGNGNLRADLVVLLDEFVIVIKWLVLEHWGSFNFQLFKMVHVFLTAGLGGLWFDVSERE